MIIPQFTAKTLRSREGYSFALAFQLGGTGTEYSVVLFRPKDGVPNTRTFSWALMGILQC